MSFHKSPLHHSLISLTPATTLSITPTHPSKYTDILSSNATLSLNPNNNTLPKVFSAPQNFVILRHELPCEFILHLDGICDVKLQCGFERNRRTQKAQILAKEDGAYVTIRRKTGEIPAFEVEWRRDAVELHQKMRSRVRDVDVMGGNAQDEWICDEEALEEERLVQRSFREKRRRSENGSARQKRDRFQDLVNSFVGDDVSKAESLSEVSDVSPRVPSSKPNKSKQSSTNTTSAGSATKNRTRRVSGNAGSLSTKPLITYVFELDSTSDKESHLVDKILRQLQMTCHRFTLKPLKQVIGKLRKREQYDSLVEHLVVVYKRNDVDQKKLDMYRLIAAKLYLVELKDQGEARSTFDVDSPTRDTRLEDEFSSLTGISTQLTPDRFSLILFAGKILPCTENRSMFRELDRKLRFDSCLGEY